jgi:hypothetical protein
MGFSITGYVLEPPLVGAANSQFTLTPANFESNPGAFSSYYSSAENVPRTDYLVLVMTDGKLPSATFGWTKNEGFVVGEAAIQRFTYDGKHQQFRPLPGSTPLNLGLFGPTLNTSTVKAPVQISNTSTSPAVAPFRLSIGTPAAPIFTFTLTLVTSFTTPAPGNVQMITTGSTAGQLLWNTTDLTNPSYQGQPILFQQQAPFTTQQSNGNIGDIGNNSLLLTPIPGTSQYPLLRIGYGLYLQAIGVSTFSPNPTIGTVEWNTTTGLLKFNSTDITNNAGTPVYYDGVLISANLTLPVQNLGTINLVGNTSPQASVLSPIPAPGGDIIFRVPGVVQFEEAVATPVASFSAVGKQGQVQYDPTTGQIQFSQADRLLYGGQTLQMVSGDLPVERGVSMRFFRCPVDLAGTDASIKDVSAIYQVTDATFQSPIIAMPQVFLPAIPIDNPTYAPYTQYPLVVMVEQGTGSFISSNLPNQTTTPTAGIGYVLDSDTGTLQYAQRYNTQSLLLQQATAIAVLPNPLVFPSNLNFAIETAPGSGFYTPFTESPPGSGVFVSTTGLGGLFDETAGQFSFTQVNEQLAEGSTGSFSGTSFTDTSADFTTDNVLPGMYLAVTSGAAQGVYTIGSPVNPTLLLTDVAGTTSSNLDYQVFASKEVLADRFFQEVELVDPNTKVERIRALGTITNSPRLSVMTTYVNVVRFRYGKGPNATFSTHVNVVANDAAFSSPSSLPQGTVEVSAATGDLNFSQVDVTAGGTVYFVRLLTQNVDYVMTPALGTITFTVRMLAEEEGLVTYTSQNAPSTVIVEPMTFLVRKELCQPHPVPTTTLQFNPLGRTVATNPTQAVWRGGRPQVIPTQCVVNASNSTITFQPDAILTNALPHGAIVNPIENVYIDYYVYEAIGGEKTTTVLQPPINLAQVNIVSDSNITAPSVIPDNTYFMIAGNYAASFPPGFLLRIETQQVYLIGSSTYDAGTGMTTVTLGGGESFTDDFQNPTLYVASGPTPLTPTVFIPSYFQTELASYEPVSIGMNQVTIAGNRTGSYKTGTILLFTTGSEQDFYEATGVTYDSTNNVTNITLARNTVLQYDVETLSYSVRPIYEAGAKVVTTTYVPVLTQPYIVWRRMGGQVGTILSSPTDYTIEPSGNITLTVPLQPGEEVSIFYTGYYTVQAGLHFRASYTNVITPSAPNGLLNQSLMANYYTFSPDSFYYRVETMTNFRGEFAQELQQDSTSGAPTSGPQTSNSSSPQLYSQGRQSIYYSEGHLANQDIIARSTLTYYNTIVNDLEAVLAAFDGRVVGDHDGLFKFDGVIGRTVSSPADALNQIDDLVQVSPFPLPNGTYQKLYIAGPYSRFFTTRRNLFTTSPCQDASGPNDGDTVAKLTFSNLSSLPSQVSRRAPRAQILQPYPPGNTVFAVDNATGTNDALQRPAFPTSGPNSPMKVVVEDPTHNESLGNSYIPASANVTVTAISGGTPQTITLSGGSAFEIPAGATITMSPSDANSMLSGGNDPPGSGGYQMVYQFGKDVDCDLGTGEIRYKKRHFPFDGTLPTTIIPKFLLIYPVQLGTTSGDILQVYGAGLFATNVAPYRFPALDGGTVDDDGDQAIPLVGPLFNGETTEAGGGPLNSELAQITNLQTLALPFVGTGTIDVSGLHITLTSGTFPGAPKQYDLVRILTGVNAGSSFHHAGTGSTTTALFVAPSEPFTYDPNPFSFEVVTTTSSLVETLSGSVTGTAFTDSGTPFSASMVGYTIVVTTGANAGLRRNIATYNASNSVTLDQSLTTDSAFSYRVDNTLATYDGFFYQSLLAAVSQELVTIGTTEEAAINQFFTDAFTVVVGPSTGTVTLPTTLTDSTQDFTEVTGSDYVYVPSGSNAGIYQIASTTPPHVLTTTQNFTAAIPTTYQIVSTFGLSFTTLTNVFSILAQNTTFVTTTTTWQTLLTTSVPVVGDAQAVAWGFLATDLTARHTVVQNRVNYLTNPATGPIALIENALTGTDRLYDARYTWIDARIDQQSGLLIQEAVAITNRIAAQANILNQLLMILAVQAA